jgi:hypothetical protein
MTMDEVKKPTTSFTLAAAIESYCNDQRAARDHDERWLAEYMQGVLNIVRQVSNANLDPELREKVTAFRLVEISRAKQAKEREIELLDLEAKKLVA